MRIFWDWKEEEERVRKNAADIRRLEKAEGGSVVRIEARAIGRVQGVGFRYFVCSLARNRRVTGWVRNMPDGSVALEVQGRGHAVMEFLREVRQPEDRYGIRVGEFLTRTIAVNPTETGFSVQM